MDRVPIIIASKQFLLRLGVKNLLSFIDIDPELYEVDSLEELSRISSKIDPSWFVVLSNDLTYKESGSKFRKVVGDLNSKKILLIENCENRSILENVDTVNVGNQQGEVIKKFQDFFSYKENDNEIGNTLLSNRETDVLRSVSTGLSNKQVADKLCISINTVVTHRKNITDKLGIKTISGLTVYALMNGIIVADDVSKT